MWNWIGMLGGGLLAAGVLLWLFMVVSLRTGFEPGVTAIRRFNRRFTNRRAMEKAGRPGAYAAIIRHVGRSSGRSYETPVGVSETPGGLVVALPYGTRPDWLKNVLAVGEAQLVHEGDTFCVTRPELVPASRFAEHQSRRERFVLRLYGVDQLLMLQRADAEVGSRVATEAGRA